MVKNRDKSSFLVTCKSQLIAAAAATMRAAATGANLPPAEVARADELAGRFPGWAEVLASSYRRIATLERTVETLSDRLTCKQNYVSEESLGVS